MKKFSLIVAMLMGCGGSPPLVPINQEDEDTGVAPEAEVVFPKVVIPNLIAEELDAGQSTEVDAGSPEADAGRDLPGNSGNNPRCDAGRGKKLGLIKHGKCEP
jgi:hypothetical protein